MDVPLCNSKITVCKSVILFCIMCLKLQYKFPIYLLKVIVVLKQIIPKSVERKTGVTTYK